MKNRGDEPTPPDLTDCQAINDPRFFDQPRKLEKQAWIDTHLKPKTAYRCKKAQPRSYHKTTKILNFNELYE